MPDTSQSEANAPYSVGAAVRVTGISEDTLRAWERRYSAIEPVRTGGGTRRYTQEHVDRLLLLKRAVDGGHRIGAIAGLPDDELRGLIEPRVDVRAVPLDDILAAAERFESREVERQLALQFSALGPEEFAHRVARPLLREIGERWERGEISPAVEHLASSITRSLLALALRERQAPTRAGAIVLATPAGERHEFGLLIASLLAAAEGYEVIHLGTDLPAEEIALAASRSGANLVILAVNGLDRESVAKELERIRGCLETSTELWIGGPPALLPEHLAGVQIFPSFEELQQDLRARRVVLS